MPEVSVFVLYNASQSSAAADLFGQVRAAFPAWYLVQDGPQAFRAGLYDWAPVQVGAVGGAGVLAESEEMAETLARRGAPAPVIAQVRQSGARIEIFWDQTDDPDPVPETADLLYDLARLLTEAVQGVALVNGSRLLVFEGSAWDQLLP